MMAPKIGPSSVNLWANNRLDVLLPGTWVAARPQQQRAAWIAGCLILNMLRIY
jgi:hypothetical protein